MGSRKYALVDDDKRARLLSAALAHRTPIRFAYEVAWMQFEDILATRSRCDEMGLVIVNPRSRDYGSLLNCHCFPTIAPSL